MATRFSRWLQHRLDERDMNYSGLAPKIGVGANTVRAWALGLSEPKPELVLKLAREFGVPAEYLYRMLGWLPPEDQPIPEEKQAIIKALLELPQSRLPVVRAFLDSLKALPGNGEGENQTVGQA